MIELYVTSADRPLRIPNMAASQNHHMVQLDSLRTVAVFAVIGSHYAESYFNFFNWGYAGGVSVLRVKRLSHHRYFAERSRKR